MFSASFIDSLSGDGLLAFDAVCREFAAFDGLHKEDRSEYHSDYGLALALLMALSEKHQDMAQPILGLSGDARDDIAVIRQAFSDTAEFVAGRLQQRTVNELLTSNCERFKQMLAGAVLYEFSDDDYKRVQILINELREIIAQSTEFAEKHQYRLIRRLERLQSELHKEMSDLDRFVGFFFDIAPRLGQLGDDVEPLLKRLDELSQIIVRLISVTDKLPAPKLTKLLGMNPAPDESDTPAAEKISG